MLDVAVAYNRYKFLGNEFLTWLWFVIDHEPDLLKNRVSDPVFLEIGHRIVLENRNRNAVETVTIKGDDANLEEGILALQKGALVTELNLCLKSGDQEWTFTIKGESLNFSSFKNPPSAPVETEEDMEGAVLESIFLYDKALQVIDELFQNFMKIRVSDQWPQRVIPNIRKWIAAPA